MDKKICEKVCELYQKGWSYERIALELELRRDEVEEQCKKRMQKEEDLARKEQDHAEETAQDAEQKEELSKEIDENFHAPFKKICKM